MATSSNANIRRDILDEDHMATQTGTGTNSQSNVGNREKRSKGEPLTGSRMGTKNDGSRE